MLTFKELQQEDIPLLRRYYVNCAFRLCEYAAGTKYMWRSRLAPGWAETAGCLVVRNTIDGDIHFDYPVPGPQGDPEAALAALEAYCTKAGIRLILSAVPEEQVPVLVRRYPRTHVVNLRSWKDYLYRAEDLMEFAGRHYSGQRNHINRFRREHPDAVFRPLTDADGPLLEQFWAEYGAEFHKENGLAQWELAASREMLALPKDDGAFCAGGILSEGKLAAVSLGERCGDTLVIHIEKALYSHAGVYPAMVQEFARCFGVGCRWINREDDAHDKGLRTSKLQYLPAELCGKVYVGVGAALDDVREIPTLHTERLTLDALTDADRSRYNALCLDEAHNRWWGYDYHDDLSGPLTEEYFLSVAREDFARRRAVNFAVRLGDQLIGEAVLYNDDWRGGMELGCRIAPEFAGFGYGTEAFSAAADWALYRVGLEKVVAKCYHENAASFKMLSSCMRKVGEDATFDYFEKLL